LEKELQQRVKLTALLFRSYSRAHILRIQQKRTHTHTAKENASAGSGERLLVLFPSAGVVMGNCESQQRTVGHARILFNLLKVLMKLILFLNVLFFLFLF